MVVGKKWWEVGGGRQGIGETDDGMRENKVVMDHARRVTINPNGSRF